ncbi:MAG: 4'-phosphopantetheinyl transferase superfamily protein [Bacteroidota bacterium]
MPLLLHRKLPNTGEIGLWRITETEDFFLDRMVLTLPEEKRLAEIKGHRRLEWLSSRWLLHIMSGRSIRSACLHDSFGKPYIANSSFEISISHSKELAAVMAAPRSVGIDIQKLVTKIGRIEYKFMREIESKSLEIESRIPHLHIYWGAKEALYKAYGRKKLDFKAHIHIQPFSFNPYSGRFYGAIHKEDFSAHYSLWYENIEDYILVYAIEEGQSEAPPSNH